MEKAIVEARAEGKRSDQAVMSMRVFRKMEGDISASVVVDYLRVR